MCERGDLAGRAAFEYPHPEHRPLVRAQPIESTAKGAPTLVLDGNLLRSLSWRRPLGHVSGDHGTAWQRSPAIARQVGGYPQQVHREWQPPVLETGQGSQCTQEHLLRHVLGFCRIGCVARQRSVYGSPAELAQLTKRMLVAITGGAKQFELTPGGLLEVACLHATSADRDSSHLRDSSLLEVRAHDWENEGMTKV